MGIGTAEPGVTMVMLEGVDGNVARKVHVPAYGDGLPCVQQDVVADYGAFPHMQIPRRTYFRAEMKGCITGDMCTQSTVKQSSEVYGGND